MPPRLWLASIISSWRSSGRRISTTPLKPDVGFHAILTRLLPFSLPLPSNFEKAIIKITVKIGEIPEPGYNSAEASVDVQVVGGAQSLNWDAIPQVETGAMMDLPFKITCPFGTFDLLTPFSAEVVFSSDGSSIDLKEIISENQESPKAEIIFTQKLTSISPL